MTDEQALGTIIRKVFGIPDPQREGEGEGSSYGRLCRTFSHSVRRSPLPVRPPGINQLISSDIDRVKTMSTPRLKRDRRLSDSLAHSTGQGPNSHLGQGEHSSKAFV